MPIFTNEERLKIWTDVVETDALKQLQQTSQLPIISNHIATMPDVHGGKGSTIGSVIPTKSAIIPAAVGVDLGCGMVAIQLSLNASDLPVNLSTVRTQIERDIPVGFDMYKQAVADDDVIKSFYKGLKAILDKYPNILNRRNPESWKTQLGTLGGGNHFIELCLDENDNVWVMLHSGSRGIGNAIGTFFIERAKTFMKSVDYNLPDKDLSWLAEGTEVFDDYVNALWWAQYYAKVNREIMLSRVLQALHHHNKIPPFTVTKEAINCHHNYVAKEVHYGEEVYLTRKGAISAREGELGIIPGSMGTKSFIVRGKGNPESFCSCSHGAGRKMSRTKAKKHFSLQDMQSQTAGVECRKDKDVIDEIPGAYKNIDQVMFNQSDLVDVVHTLKQVLCVKG